MGCSPPGSSVHGLLQARILEWVAMPHPGDLPDPGVEVTLLCLLHWQAGSLPLTKPGKAHWSTQESSNTGVHLFKTHNSDEVGLEQGPGTQ